MDEAENMEGVVIYHDHCIEELQKKKFELEQARKLIFQTHNNPTDDALEICLKQYYCSDEQDETLASVYLKKRLSVVFYELKKKNPERFDSLVLLISSMKS